MDTLYDLLGALPHDDAEDLRAAFRRAVKGAHPDLRPGDPDAALKFRQIVRANEILGDTEQRAAYDHLLVLARRERQLASLHPIAARIHSLASTVIALAGASIVAVGGYLLFMQMSTASVAPTSKVEVAMRVSPDSATVRPADSPDPADQITIVARREKTDIPADAAVRSAAAPTSSFESFPAPSFGVAPDLVLNDARFFHARGVFAYRYGNLNGAIADLDQAIQLDPSFSASYVDRGIVFYRLRKFDRAFADIARAKQIEKESRPQSKPTTARKSHSDQTAVAPSITPLARRSTAQNLTPDGAFERLTFQ